MNEYKYNNILSNDYKMMYTILLLKRRGKILPVSKVLGKFSVEQAMG